MLLSVVLRKHCEIHKMGIDMSSAFDTIKRSTVLKLLHDAGCSGDDVRLVRLLLANTSVVVRVNSATSTMFMSTVGAFQGDSLSGCIFTLSLAGALNQLRTMYVNRPIIPIGEDEEDNADMPLEWQYADDCDFIDTDLGLLNDMLPVCTGVLKEWDLTVNGNKTEFTHLYLASKDDRDDKGNLLLGNEPWRTSKSLGSLLCSTKDIQNRILLCQAAFQSYSKVWLQGRKIPLKRKLLLYDAQVVSVLVYNCGCWSAPKNIMSKLDTCHRRHLRRICNIHWPGVITNKEFYRRCDTIPITERVKQARWKFLGHVLRMDENTPAFLSLRYAIAAGDIYTGRLGRPRINLYNFVKEDLKSRNIPLETISDRSRWKNLF